VHNIITDGVSSEMATPFHMCHIYIIIHVRSCGGCSRPQPSPIYKREGTLAMPKVHQKKRNLTELYYTKIDVSTCT